MHIAQLYSLTGWLLIGKLKRLKHVPAHLHFWVHEFSFTVTSAGFYGDLVLPVTYQLAFDIDTFFASHKPHHPIYQGDQDHWLAPHNYLHSANQNQIELLRDNTVSFLQY